jgi:DNA/RNA endonuclease YhcR with UshA esterase domain
MRLLKALTVLLAVGGVIALIVAARATPRPLMRIAAIQPAMNFGYVRVQGTVMAFPSFSARDRYLSFQIWDGSGELRVTAYRAVVDALLSGERIPLPGDRVSVEGTLRIRDDEPSLILNAADGLLIETPAATNVQLSALGDVALGERVEVTAQVRRARPIGPALSVITLRHGDATADALLSRALPALATLSVPAAGDWVTVAGAVGEYRGNKQVLVTAVRPAAALDTPRWPIAELNSDLVGRWVGIEGQVTDLRPFRAGMRADVTDDSGGSITVVMFDEIWNGLPFSMTLDIADRLAVAGEVSEYRGRVELIPQLPADVRLLAAP